MTHAEIDLRIEEIKVAEGSYYGDDMAFILENRLRDDFIRYVATLDDLELANKAKKILSTNSMEFERWYG